MSTDWDGVELTKSASNFIDNSGSPDTLEELPGIGLACFALFFAVKKVVDALCLENAL